MVPIAHRQYEMRTWVRAAEPRGGSLPEALSQQATLRSSALQCPRPIAKGRAQPRDKGGLQETQANTLAASMWLGNTLPAMTLTISVLKAPGERKVSNVGWTVGDRSLLRRSGQKQFTRSRGRDAGMGTPSLSSPLRVLMYTP